MHVIALVRADPGKVCQVLVRQVGRKLAKVHDVRHARRVVLYILVRDKGIVLALVELVAACGRQQVAVAQ